MSFDNLHLIPEDLTVERFHQDTLANYQKYAVVLRGPGNGQPWILYVDELYMRNEVILKKQQAMMHFQTIRMNPYHAMVALLTGLPLKTILTRENLIAEHFELLGFTMADMEAWRIQGVSAQDAALKIRPMADTGAVLQ